MPRKKTNTFDLFNRDINAWYQHVNRKQKGVVWHMNTEHARDKLKSLYPALSVLTKR